VGFRFRKSVKIIPGVRLNFSKSGISTSVGGSGATVNFGKRGTRQTIGIPGSGISFSSFTPKSAKSKPGGDTDMAKRDAESGVGCLILVGLFIVTLAQCERSDKIDVSAAYETAATTTFGNEIERQPAAGNALIFEADDTVYVTASTLNGRSEPSTTGSVVTKLDHGQSASVVDRSGEWLKVATTAGAVWIASQHVGSSPPPRPQPVYSTPSRSSPARGNYRDDNCPCSGSRVCIGPRGGRYCITSGGNKRYGV
jgi:hypothetical protein